MPKQWKTVGQNYIYKAKTPDEVSFVIDRVVGPYSEFDYVHVDCPYDVVFVVGIDERHRVLMLRQYRYLVREELWEIPAGSPNPGESLEDGARREFEEEGGYKVGELVKVGAFFSSVGLTNQLCHIYLATDLNKSRQNLDDGEAIRVQWIPFQDAVKLVAEGQVMNVGAAYGLLLAKMWLNRGKHRV